MPDPAAIVQKWMLTLADEIASQAEAAADGFKDVSGDIALRAFAASIRKTSADCGFIPKLLNN